MGTSIEIPTYPVAQFIPTPDNPRTVRENQALREMADSIRKHGILEPLLARPHPTKKNKFDLRAGARRLAAAKLAGAKVVPAIVREMTDEEALEVTVIENLQREDLHPMEEAKGIQTLLDRGWTLDQAADNLGRSAKWVARRASLTRLTPAWLQFIEEDELIAEWPAAMLELVSRLPEPAQDRVCESVRNSMRFSYGRRERWTTQKLSGIVAEQLHIIAHAPWKKDDETIPTCPACTACTARSDLQAELFDVEYNEAPEYPDNEPGVCVKCKRDIYETEDDWDWVNDSENLCQDCWEKERVKMAPQAKCLDVECWAAKLEATVQRNKKQLEVEHGAIIMSGSYNARQEGRPFAEHIIEDWNWDEVKKGTKGAKPVLFVDGPRAGQHTWGKLCNSASPKAKSRAGEKKPMTLKERRQGLKKKRLKWIANALIEEIGNLVDGDVILEGVEFEQDAMLALVLALGTAESNDSVNTWAPKSEKTWRDYDVNLERSYEEMVDYLFASALKVLRARLRNLLTMNDIYEPELKRACQVIKVDYPGLETQAAEEIPEPKAWANLRADGTPKGKARVKKKEKKKV